MSIAGKNEQTILERGRKREIKVSSTKTTVKQNEERK